MDLGEMFTEFVSDVVGALPAIIAAIIVLSLDMLLESFLEGQ